MGFQWVWDFFIGCTIEVYLLVQHHLTTEDSQKKNKKQKQH